MFLVLLWVSRIATAKADLADEQLLKFKENHSGPIGVLTTNTGVPVEYSEANYSFNISSLINDNYFMDTITHLDRERLPERIVHAKGAGAFGYFEVTNDLSDVCRAEVFDTVGKKTPIAVRFSSVAADRGGNDLIPDTRGFAVKFYTKEGNFDIVGLNTPVFVLKDPIGFPNFAHSKKRNPATNLFDYNMLWEFITLHPESMFVFLYVFANRGTPRNYRYMPGFSIHTYQVENFVGETHFVRFHILPDLGIQNLTLTESKKVGAEDPDYYSRDLYDSIAMKKYPCWTVYVQVLSTGDAKTAGFDIFDTTKLLPEEKYPLRELGKIVLNINPLNFFAEVEQLAYCPSNLVPGIVGAPDKLFEGRRLSYIDAQYYRLGANFKRIPVNCPYRSKLYTYTRDGRPTFDDNGKDAPNYYPNSFYGPVPYTTAIKTKLVEIKQGIPDNFGQAGQFVKNLPTDQKNMLISNLAENLAPILKLIRDRAVKIITTIDGELGKKLAAKLACME